MFARIQTLYLFLAGALATASIWLPFWSFSADKIFVISDFASFSQVGILFVSESCFAGGIFSPLTAIVAFLSIFLFSNRALQSKLILLGVALFLGDLFSGLTAAHFMNQHFESLGVAVKHWPEAGFYLLLPEPVLLLLALKGVKQDDKIANAYKRL